MIFDNVPYLTNIHQSTIITVLAMATNYKAYMAFHATPYVASSFYLPLGLSTFFGLSIIGRYFDRINSVARIYLLNSGNIVRITYANGKLEDVPVSALKFFSASKLTKSIIVDINSKNYSLKLSQNTYIEPHLLYAILRPEVY